MKCIHYLGTVRQICDSKITNQITNSWEGVKGNIQYVLTLEMFCSWDHLFLLHFTPAKTNDFQGILSLLSYFICSYLIEQGCLWSLKATDIFMEVIQILVWITFIFPTADLFCAEKATFPSFLRGWYLCSQCSSRARFLWGKGCNQLWHQGQSREQMIYRKQTTSWNQMAKRDLLGEMRHMRAFGHTFIPSGSYLHYFQKFNSHHRRP